MRRPEDLYRRFGPSVLGRCQRVLGDPAAAEDAMQEVFVRALKHLDAIPEPDAEALAWLYRVGTNVCLDHLRAKHVRAAAPAPPPPAAPPDPARLVEERRACVRALSEVPQALAEPAMLYYLDEVDQGQVAKILGVSRRTVIARLSKFLERARLALGGGEP
ncbi:MAG: sigma-70 family RNA polymerase sigma factor [Myxococcales bacterium]